MSRARIPATTSPSEDLRYRRIVGARLGLLYGVTLLALAFKLSREGRETDLAVQLLTAPFGLLVPEVVFTGTIVLWTLVGIGASMAQRATLRYSVVGVVVIQYLAAMYSIRAAVATPQTSIASAFKAAPLLVAASLAVYLIGQATIWVMLWRNAKASPLGRA